MEATTKPLTKEERREQVLQWVREMAERYRETNELLDQILPDLPEEETPRREDSPKKLPVR